MDLVGSPAWLLLAVIITLAPTPSSTSEPGPLSPASCAPPMIRPAGPLTAFTPAPLT